MSKAASSEVSTPTNTKDGCVVLPKRVGGGPTGRALCWPVGGRILVVDDHALFAESLAVLLQAEEDLEVVGIARTNLEAQNLARTNSPDIVTLDVDLGGEDGLAIVPAMRSIREDIRVLVVSCRDDPREVVRALSAGVVGWVPKDAGSDTLLEVIRGAMDDQSWLPPRLLTSVLRELVSRRDAADQAVNTLASLTVRERQILELMVDGLDSAEIAQRLYVSQNTVRTHAQAVLRKLGVHSRLEAVSLALRLGLTPEQ